MGFCIACMFLSVKIVNAEENSSTIEVDAEVIVWPANGEPLEKETASIAYYYLANYELTSGYGTRKDPFSGHSKIHHGIDLSKAGYTDMGDPILVIKDGIVVELEKNNGGAGYTVKIQHSDHTLSRYAHLMRGSTDTLMIGQNVMAGDVIGKLGNTGRSTGPHLHLEMTDESGNLIDGYAELHRMAEPVDMAIKAQVEMDEKKNEIQIAALEEMFEEQDLSNWNVSNKSEQQLASSVIVSSSKVESKIDSSEQTDIQRNSMVVEVKKNMTLWGLSQEFGVSIQSIKDWNGLTSDTIDIGQKLKLKTDSEKIYIVNSGDTLPEIANEIGVSIEIIKDLNNLSESTVFPNQVLRVK